MLAICKIKSIQFSPLCYGIYFEDFEGPAYSASANGAHSGAKSYSGQLDISGLSLSASSKYIVRVWYKGNNAPNIFTSSDDPMTFIGQSGEWSLYEKEIDGTGDGFAIKCDSQSSIDDVRIQPSNSTATCYVYDLASFRLLAQFDDRHFGLFYEYNDEGKLIRKIIETERGMKTVQETQYNTPKSARN